MPSDLRRLQRVTVYALARREDGATLLVDPASSGAASLPSATVEHGEHPRSAAERALAVLAIPAQVKAAVHTFSDVAHLPEGDVLVHTVGLVYEVDLLDGINHSGEQGAAFLAPPEALSGQPLTDVTASLLGLRPFPADGRHPFDPPFLAPATDAPIEVVGAADEPAPVAAPAIQRPAVYARVVDGDRVLLTRLTNAEGLWTLPGGGIDFGEDPRAALAREMHEETGLPFTAGRLVDVDSRRFTGHAPGGRLEDFHGIRIIFEGQVPVDVEPRVVEVGGSTDAAAWVSLSELARTPMTTLASGALADVAAP